MTLPAWDSRRRGSSPYPPPLTLDDLYAAYHFDEASGNALDATANARTLTNNFGVGATTGVFSGARSFAGVATFSRANEAAQGFTTKLSVCFFANPVTNATLQRTYVQKSASGQEKFRIVCFPSGNRFRFEFNGSNYGFVSPLTVGVFTHVAWTYNGLGTANVNNVYSSTDRLKLYLDGVVQTLGIFGTVPATLASSTNAIKVGGDGVINHYDGSMDELNLWAKELSATDVTTIMAAPYPWGL